MDPNSNTRLEFTNHLVCLPIPDNAAPKWKKVVEAHKVLLDKLAQHEAMAPNVNQTYMEPAVDKNKVYFEWDFVGRTLGFLYNVNPTLENLTTKEKGTWTEATGRAGFAKMLITDQSGMLDSMTESTYPGQTGNHPEFGSEILALAEKLDEGLED